MLSNERIKEIIESCLQSNERMDNKIIHIAFMAGIKQSIIEAEPLIRKDEREKIAEWLDQNAYVNGGIYGRVYSAVAEQLRNQK